MEKDILNINGIKVEAYSFNTVVVGSGAAAFGAADRLYNFGQKDIAMVTENINCGTSRNAGSDKQTYYKLTVCGGENDSVYAMAQNLFDGGATDGDNALCEAALSAQSFYRLAEMGVPFPCNAYGEYVGYKTDHDPRKRATSAGPLTSKMMTEALEREVKKKEIKIFSSHTVIKVLEKDKKVRGVLCLNTENADKKGAVYTVFFAENIIYATGGPAGIYRDSVYPKGHHGAHGCALEAGVRAQNLTEWQYGIASTKFRWNLSGTYQQVIPTYISTDENGCDAREFLDEYFETDEKMLNAIFLKGYQWPFDPRKIENGGSSAIDLLVYNETAVKKRRVWLDFRRNPSALKENLTNIGKEGYEYLKNSDALLKTPIERLRHMNTAAIELYRNHGIDLETEMLEIAVCAQHQNGGLSVDSRWESNLEGFFPIGECSGTHGVYRPGGSALNAGQCGGLRATQYIAARRNKEAAPVKDCAIDCMDEITKRIEQCSNLFKNKQGMTPKEMNERIGERMSKYVAHIRSCEGAEKVYKEAREDYLSFWDLMTVNNPKELREALICYDMLITQQAVAYAVADYIKEVGLSRGSFLIADNKKDIESYLKSEIKTQKEAATTIQVTEFGENGVSSFYRAVRPIPKEDGWFENVWNDYLEGKYLDKSVGNQ